MNKRNVVCYKVYANVAPGIYNHLVYCPIYEGWTYFTFVTCLNCGELFVIDWNNPLTSGKSIVDIAGDKKCPTCNNFLKETLAKYPQNIKLENGKTGSYYPDNYIPPDEEFFRLLIFELQPD